MPLLEITTIINSNIKFKRYLLTEIKDEAKDEEENNFNNFFLSNNANFSSLSLYFNHTTTL